MDTTMHKENKVLERTVIGGSSTEALTGAGAVVLAILGLAHIAPQMMVAVAAIALGAALIMDGAAVAAEYSRILAESGDGKISKSELGGGLSTQVVGGVAAVVLGVLALLNIEATTLLAIAAIVLGVTVISSGGVTTRLNALKIEASDEHEVAKRVAHEALTTATGTDILVGLAAVVLGILALVGIAPTTLTLVAMLALGASILLTGGAVIGKMMSMFAA
jgi:hypothetical protein